MSSRTGEEDAELSAALGWPGGISEPLLDRAALLRMISALRADAERYREWRRAFREDVMLGVDDDEAKEIQNDYSDS
ncbi:MAG: hypothetical protein ACK5QX_12070, partial [bacterium]|jgi:hypothetical protein